MTEAVEIRIIKVASCPSLSSKSTLTYNIGSNEQSEMLIRVQANSGGGYFNQDWVALDDIQKAIEKVPHITSFSLRQMYPGKSMNSPGFLLAVLKAEGLVKLKGEKERVYIALDAEPFIAEMKALMASTSNAETATPAAAIKKSKKG